MNFRASFCDPFKPDIIEIGKIEREKILETFHKIPWTDRLSGKNENRKTERNFLFAIPGD